MELAIMNMVGVHFFLKWLKFSWNCLFGGVVHYVLRSGLVPPSVYLIEQMSAETLYWFF